MLHSIVTLCPKTSVSSFICKIIGHLFIARGCDTKIKWNEKVCEKCVHFFFKLSMKQCLQCTILQASAQNGINNTGVHCCVLVCKAVTPEHLHL